MAKETAKRGDLKLDVIAMRGELARRIATYAQSAGEHPTHIHGLVLSRRTAPTARYRAMFEPSLNVFAQGQKRITFGGTAYSCDASSFVLSSIDLSVESQIVEASEEVPLLSMPCGRSLAGRVSRSGRSSVQRRGLAVGETTVGLLSACARLIELLDTPEDVPFLSHLIQCKIRGSLAYTLIGGTAVGTVLTLVFLPALYTIWFRVKPTVRQPAREGATCSLKQQRGLN